MVTFSKLIRIKGRLNITVFYDSNINSICGVVKYIENINPKSQRIFTIVVGCWMVVAEKEI